MLFLACLPASALAKPTPGSTALQSPCFLTGHADETAARLKDQPQRFQCGLDPLLVEHETLWIRYDLGSQHIDAAKNWSYNHALIQAKDEQVWAIYEDGSLHRSATGREQARRIFGGPTQHYALGTRPGTIKALIIRIDGLENRRGAVPRAKLTSQAESTAQTIHLNLAFGVMAGIMLGIMFYNFTLYLALGYRVLRTYCLSILAILFHGVIWSNLILWLAPSLSTKVQFGLNALSISVAFLAVAAYLESFLEEEMAPPTLIRATQILGILAVVISFARFITDDVSWRALDTLLYTAFLGLVGLLIATNIVAWRRGSRAVKFFLLAWLVPLAIVSLRILWGMGKMPVETALFDASPFISLSLEAILSAIGLSWRLRQLARERDKAMDQADELYKLANMDPLTGIANRRCFYGRALWEGARNNTVQLLLIDVDRFKSVNDGFGHDVGDRVLQRVANAIAGCGADVIGRLGGDEFAIVTPRGDAAALARAIDSHLLNHMSPDDIGITLSMGIAAGPLRHEQDWQLLYIASDRALYDSKRGGRAQLTDYSAGSLIAA